jgi:glucose/mannose-6-phosphate isomerase
MLDLLNNFSAMCKEAAEIGIGAKAEKFNKIVVAGMGGSGLPGHILKCYFYGKDVPVFVCNDYKLPAFADKNTIVFAVSYSGNTEETLAAFDEALEKKCILYAIASGATLEKKARENNVPFLKVPAGMQPRHAVIYQFFALLNVLKNSGLVKDFDNDLNELTETIEKNDFKTVAKYIAEKLHNKIPVVYASDRFYAVAYKWKINFNENSKQAAFFNTIPEMNHNEINGYKFMSKDIMPIFLRNKKDLPKIQKRMDITKKLVGNSIDVDMIGKGLLTNIFSTIHLGDWTSYFLALKNGVEPDPVPVVEELKKMLRE